MSEERSMTGVVLVVDDHASSRESMCKALRREGHTVHSFDSGRKALSFLEQNPGTVDAVITDLKMPEMDGLEVLKEVKAREPELGVLLVTAYASLSSALEAGKEGVVDYLEKPVDLKVLRNRAGTIIENSLLRRKNAALERLIEGEDGFHGLKGKSKAMRDLYDRIRLVGPTGATVLITGESGTGKELIANAIHRTSPRKDRICLPLNCSAIPRDILESELFGHERGSFTGAVERKVGKFEQANHGTLFLDEIGDLAPETQVKLLRAIEELSFMRLGGSEMIRIDTRVIAATNRDLETMVAEGRFRSDLYYRLKVVHLRVPPLRARREDIPLLAGYFLQLSMRASGKPMGRIAERLMKRFVAYDWPGNVRELRNLMESMVVLSTRDHLDLDDIPPGERLAELEDLSGESAAPPATSAAAADRFATMEERERAAILDALRQTGGNRTRAAELLGIGLRTLHRKLKGYQDFDHPAESND